MKITQVIKVVLIGTLLPEMFLAPRLVLNELLLEFGVSEFLQLSYY
jgi:hypothetical protein